MEIDTIQYESDGFSKLETWCNTTSHAFEKVYVSFGSKFNSSSIQFHYPETITCNRYCTNAVYQMVPSFMRFSENEMKRNLAIVIDNFHEPNSMKETMDYLLTTIQTNEHITIIIINKQLSSISITNCLSVITQFITQQKIKLKNTMFANYICFQHPNKNEALLEEDIYSTISRILKVIQNGIYQKRFYQWYGMRFYCYNYLYSYQDYELLHALDMMKLQPHIFQKLLGDTPLNTIDYDNIDQLLTTYGRSLQGRSLQVAWSNFRRYTINIIDDYDT
jgi:hypothetical protein